MKEAKIKGAELVCFGEAFIQGFNALLWNYEEDKNIAIPTTSPEFAKIKAFTKEIGIDVLFGYNELANDCIYSSCAIISGGELIHNYRRISKGWKEYSKTDEHYKEGSSVEIFEYKGIKCLIGLCGDLWDYPERFSLGEGLLLWPVYTCWTREEWGKRLQERIRRAGAAVLREYPFHKFALRWRCFWWRRPILRWQSSKRAAHRQ